MTAAVRLPLVTSETECAETTTTVMVSTPVNVVLVMTIRVNEWDTIEGR